MSTLHTVNKSAFERGTLVSCLNHLSPGDAVLLIEDGVLGARKGSSVAGAITAAMKGCKVIVLGPDLAARGMKGEDIIEGIESVDYAGFVDLASAHERVNSWL